MAPEQDGFTNHEQEPAMSFLRFSNSNSSRFINYSGVVRQQGRVTVDADWNTSLFEPPIDPALLVLGS